MKRPLAYRHLTRIHELVNNASICRVVVERELAKNDLVEAAADTDRAMAEEVLSLAKERSWSLPSSKSYAWSLLSNFSDPLPRIRRVLDRDVFELEGFARDTDDDDVASLAVQLLSERRQLKRRLEALHPGLALPGSK